MRKYRVLVLVHEDLVPKEDVAQADVAPEWRMEWDVVTTLRRRGHELRVIGVHDDLTPIRSAIDEFKPTIVFNLMEAFADVGVFDQNVVSYLELLRIPYTGCNPRGLTLSRDKALARKLLAYHRIPSPDFTVAPLNRKPVLPRKLSFPLIVKSLTFESSIGISQASVVANEEQLQKRVKYIHDTILTPAIIEQFIDGREIYVGVMGNHRLRVFPVWEMTFAKMSDDHWHIATERVKWNVKYQKRHGIDTAEAELPEGLAPKIQHLAKRAYRALDLCGYARIDFRLDANGKAYVIEANANPQLAEEEDFAQSAKRAKMSYSRLLERILALGLQWQPHRMGGE
ncbi:MAG: ATP-grasp domain-containing protein [Deltaproteobacteria bacterium]|nr:ATP-grasp domain-containing protein [Deltaproteobacteria bacterium]